MESKQFIYPYKIENQVEAYRGEDKMRERKV